MRIQGHAAKALLGAGLLAGALGAAQAEGLYIGGNLSQPDYRATINGIDGGTGDTGYKLYGGYDFNRYFAVEGGYFDLGKGSNAVGHINGRGFYVDGVGTFPVWGNFSLLGSAGIEQAKFKTSLGDDSSSGYKLGAGVQYDFSKQVAMRVQYERYRFGDVFDNKLGVGSTSVGLKYGF